MKMVIIYSPSCHSKHEWVSFLCWTQNKLCHDNSRRDWHGNVHDNVNEQVHPPKNEYGYFLLFFETTIMGNTADLAMVQKMIIDTLHKEGKSQRVIKGVAVQGVLHQSILNAKLTGRKKLGRKMCTSNRDDRKLANTVKQSWTLGRASQGVDWSCSQCIKNHHAQTSSGKGLPSHFWNRNIVRSILPRLRRKRSGLLLSGPKSSFQMKVNVAFYLEIKVPESGVRVERHRIQAAWSPVWSFHNQWWFGLPCHLLVLVQSQRSNLPGNEILEHFMPPSADKLYGDADFLFQQDLATAHAAKGPKSGSMTMCYCDWSASKLAWPESHRESMGYCQEEDERYQNQQCKWPEGRYQSSVGFHYTRAVPQADCLHATPQWCSNSCKRKPNQVLSA